MTIPINKSSKKIRTAKTQHDCYFAGL